MSEVTLCAKNMCHNASVSHADSPIQNAGWSAWCVIQPVAWSWIPRAKQMDEAHMCVSNTLVGNTCLNAGHSQPHCGYPPSQKRIAKH